MSTYELTGKDLGLNFRSNDEHEFSTASAPDLIDKDLIGNSPLEKKWGVNVESLKKFVCSHLVSNVDYEVSKGIYTDAQVTQMYESCYEEIDDIEQWNPMTITEDQLIYLIQKSNSFRAEIHDLKHGNAYNPPQARKHAVVERVLKYTEAL
jgi:hypothetical protein